MGTTEHAVNTWGKTYTFQTAGASEAFVADGAQVVLIAHMLPELVIRVIVQVMALGTHVVTRRIG